MYLFVSWAKVRFSSNILDPGAMGTSKQVASDSTAEGQAENRRVVVRVLQNKGIAGSYPP
jgi:OOP family OmpA-OmpF porin